MLALTLTACSRSPAPSRPQTAASRPAADLLTPPPTFAPPPTSIDPDTGQPALTGKDALPWALDTLDVGGAIRGRLVRLQAWVKAMLGQVAAVK